MPTVLAVDDTPEVRNAIRRILVRAGYDVVCAEDGRQALELAAQREIHAAVVDYNMPSMDGLTLLTRLGELQPATVCVLVSGALDVDVVMAAVNRGEISGVLHKPFNADSLISLLDRGIQRRAISSQSWYATQETEAQREGQELRRLLTEGITLALQPIVEASTRRAIGFEGLLRPSSPILPTAARVIAAAERNHAIREITRLGVRQAVTWLGALPQSTSVFLNIHPSELEDTAHLIDALSPVAAHAERVVIEITERRSLSQASDWRTAIAGLRANGFRIAIDDLGAGASSLSALAQIDPDIVKIDMSLVRGIDSDLRKQRVVDVICRFANASNVQVVAEGIETESEAETVTELGADLLQGFVFGKAESTQQVVLHAANAPSLLPPREHSTTRHRVVPIEDLDAAVPSERATRRGR